MKRASLVLGLTLAYAADAGAQMHWTDKIFVNGNGGYQAGSHDVDVNTKFTVYDEDGTLIGTQSLKARPIFDGSAGYRVRNNLALGLGFTQYRSKSDVAVVAQIPDPVLFDRPRTVSLTGSGAKHTASAVHMTASWFWPYTEKIDFAFSGGPSIVFVKQDLISGLNIQPETGPSFATPVVDRIIVTEQRKTTIGFNAGVDAAYMFTQRYGAGVTVRYTWASADLPGLSDSLTIGGFQVLGGLRLRFQ